MMFPKVRCPSYVLAVVGPHVGFTFEIWYVMLIQTPLRAPNFGTCCLAWMRTPLAFSICVCVDYMLGTVGTDCRH